jgi:hypothetical protein
VAIRRPWSSIAYREKCPCEKSSHENRTKTTRRKTPERNARLGVALTIVPEAASTTQFTAFFMLAVVPSIFNGNQTYVLAIKLLLTHRSPIYIAFPLTLSTNVV